MFKNVNNCCKKTTSTCLTEITHLLPSCNREKLFLLITLSHAGLCTLRAIWVHYFQRNLMCNNDATEVSSRLHWAWKWTKKSSISWGKETLKRLSRGKLRKYAIRKLRMLSVGLFLFLTFINYFTSDLADVEMTNFFCKLLTPFQPP